MFVCLFVSFVFSQVLEMTSFAPEEITASTIFIA